VDSRRDVEAAADLALCSAMSGLAEVVQNLFSLLAVYVEGIFGEVVTQDGGGEGCDEGGRGPETRLVGIGQRDVEIKEAGGR
jgi:hypothetical protein